MNYRETLSSFGIEIPSVLLPQAGDLRKWPVIACDQFTQDRDYWEKVISEVDGAPSTLNLIFPEVYLCEPDAVRRIAGIHSAMSAYLKEGVFQEEKKGFIYVERDTPFNKKRRGLIAAIDLERYEWKSGARPLIRCTEGIIEERLPPRMDIRRGAPLEIPHTLLLIDDKECAFLPAAGELAKKNTSVYDTPLLMDSGNISGWFLGTENDMALIAGKLEELYSRRAFGYDRGKPFLFAVGDGNHSLAAAKGVWEEYKASCGSAAFTHPCRYAMVEIENIYDPAVQFEPIHRLVLGAGFDEIVSILSQLPGFLFRKVNSADELTRLCALPSARPDAANCFGVASENSYALIETSADGIATVCLQPLLDGAAPGSNFKIDYIHDEEELLRLSAAGNTGILLPTVRKSGLFETITALGPLPRKSFSMGHSCEKRFYLECRRLFG
jgi:hypothetical protein